MTRRVVEAIQEACPPQLFVIADGPRSGRPDEKRRCRETRSVVEDIRCESLVHRNYADENLGLRQRVVSGLNWVFDHVDRAIILEDDCMPDRSFFSFCEELLDRYADHSHVMSISGDNFQPRPRSEYSYYFSRYMHCWGWATWRSAWRHYDVDMESWPEVREGPWIEQLFASDRAASYWRSVFDRVYQREVDSWAYVWQYSIWMNGGVNILPEKNLVSNIGHGEEATHTRDAGWYTSRSISTLKQPLEHPPCIVRHADADDYTQRWLYDQTTIRKIMSRTYQYLRNVLPN
ncbi:hypothetical protein BSZ35_09135 [Salinibacter sp. 10B]|nr:hypothetical protein BSZ35_09135 [Salinibacter sp. 10B]